LLIGDLVWDEAGFIFLSSFIHMAVM